MDIWIEKTWRQIKVIYCFNAVPFAISNMLLYNGNGNSKTESTPERKAKAKAKAKAHQALAQRSLLLSQLSTFCYILLSGYFISVRFQVDSLSLSFFFFLYILFLSFTFIHCCIMLCFAGLTFPPNFPILLCILVSAFCFLSLFICGPAFVVWGALSILFTNITNIAHKTFTIHSNRNAPAHTHTNIEWWIPVPNNNSSRSRIRIIFLFWNW